MRAGKAAGAPSGPAPQGLLTSDPVQTGSVISVGPEEKECRDESKANTPPASQASPRPLPESGLFSAENSRRGRGGTGYRMGPKRDSRFPGPDPSPRCWRGKVSAVGTWGPASFTAPTSSSTEGRGPSPSAASSMPVTRLSFSPPYHRPSPSPALGAVTAAEADTLTTPRSWGPLTQAGQLFQGPQGAPQLLRPHPAQRMGPVFRAQQTVSNSSQGVVTPCVRPLLGQGCVLDKRVVTLGLQNPGQGGWGWGGSRRNF